MKIYQKKIDENSFSRYEFKFIISKNVSNQIKAEAGNFMSEDIFLKKSKNYLVRSLYFDNDYFYHFRQKIDGIKSRHKFRLRTYSDYLDNNTDLFLEIKGRTNLRTYKKRLKIFSKDLENFCNNKELFSLKKKYFNNKLLSNFIFDTFKKRIKPVVVIDYKRYPLIGKNGLYFRLTFDSQISAIKSNNIFYKKKEEQPKACIPGYEILELKFDNNIPPWFHRIIQSYNLKRVSVSKFVLGCEATGLAFDHDGR